jgi:hypothetical protein
MHDTTVENGLYAVVNVVSLMIGLTLKTTVV